MWPIQSTARQKGSLKKQLMKRPQQPLRTTTNKKSKQVTKPPMKERGLGSPTDKKWSMPEEKRAAIHDYTVISYSKGRGLFQMELHFCAHLLEQI